MTKPSDPKRRRELLNKLAEHLDSAQAITDELDEGMAGYLGARALDEVRSITWPETDLNIEVFRKTPGR